MCQYKSEALRFHTCVRSPVTAPKAQGRLSEDTYCWQTFRPAVFIIPIFRSLQYLYFKCVYTA